MREQQKKPRMAIADWLSLAAAPAFGLMALVTAMNGRADMLCTTAADAWPLSGMTLMYLMMSVFHCAPWLKRISSRQSRIV
jgi:hypothetical protein